MHLFGVTQRAGAEVVVGDRAGGLTPEAGAEVDDLAHAVQPGAGLQVQHVAADDDRLGGGAGERVRAQQGVGLQADVVVHQHDLVDVGVLDGLVQAAGEATGAAEVLLLDDLEAVAENGRGLGEALGVADLHGALVGDEDLLQHVEHGRVLAERAQRDDRVDRAHGRHTDGDLLRGQVLLGRPRRLVDLQRGVVGEDVEPDPAAVLVRLQIDLERDLGPRLGATDRGAFQVDDVAAGLGAVDVDASRATDGDPQDHVLDDRPAPPVGSRGTR